VTLSPVIVYCDPITSNRTGKNLVKVKFGQFQINLNDVLAKKAAFKIIS